ncbi:DUF4258 domain-containing protein [bacterium]|nr:DUF4258 domain-containing protein [bacterium]
MQLQNIHCNRILYYCIHSVYKTGMHFSFRRGVMQNVPSQQKEKNMRTQPITLTAHARFRMDQRGVSTDSIELALRHGDAFPCGKGDRCFFISHKCVKRHRDLHQHKGIAVILTRDGEVKTVYRNRDLRPRDLFRQWDLSSARVHPAPKHGRRGIVLN